MNENSWFILTPILNPFCFFFLIFFYYYWFFSFSFHSTFCTSIMHAPFLDYLLFHVLSSSSGGWGEPAGLQRAAGHGGAEEDGSPGPTEVAKEGRPPESHPAPRPAPATSQTLPQLPRGQPIPSGPQQDSRDRYFWAERSEHIDSSLNCLLSDLVNRENFAVGVR